MRLRTALILAFSATTLAACGGDGSSSTTGTGGKGGSGGASAKGGTSGGAKGGSSGSAGNGTGGSSTGGSGTGGSGTGGSGTGGSGTGGSGTGGSGTGGSGTGGSGTGGSGTGGSGTGGSGTGGSGTGGSGTGGSGTGGSGTGGSGTGGSGTGGSGTGGSGTGGSGTGGSGTGGSGTGGSGTGGSGTGGSGTGGTGTGGTGTGGTGGGAQTFTVGGTVSGLVGTGLSLADGLGHQVDVTANGAFMFAMEVAAGSNVAVTVAQQPTAPVQVCTVTGGTINAIAQDTNTVAVTCVTNRYHVGGSVSGLAGTGLVLQDNGGDDLPITADGAFTFATTVASGATFTVSIKTQPTGPAQTCQLSSASGTVGASDVTGVVVNCATNSYTVGGSVSGLAGTGLVLQNNGGNDLSVNANGSFSFSTPMVSGSAFAVTVKTQPTAPTQTCSVSQGSGNVASGNVTTVAVVCSTQAYAVGGTVSGLAGSGLVLQDNLGDNFAVAADGSFTFATPVPSGGLYSVSVLTPPSSPAQTCTVVNGSGQIADAAVTNVAVTCATNRYKIGGNVIGLMGSGLTLKNGGGDDLVITASGPFQFATSVLSGASFAVTIAAQPTNPAQTCTLSGGASGNVGGADVTSVTVNCSTNQHVVGGTVSGLTGAGLKLALNGGTPFAIGASGGFAFPTVLPSGATYQVTITDQPTTPWQTCMINGGTGSGTIADADIASVAVVCTTNRYKIRGTVSGLTGAGLVLRNNGGDDLAVLADGSFVFATSVPSGGGYAVTVASQPTTPWQTCAVDSGSGGVAGGDVSNVSVTCTTNDYAVGGMVTGLAGTVVLQNNAGDNIVLTANGNFAFPAHVASGGSYQVTVLTQPTVPYQTCAVSSGSGTVTNAAITDVLVTCVTNKYTVGGTIIGLAGSNFVLQNNAGDDLVLGATNSFTFATAIDSGTNFAVTIKTQPSAPTQTCSVGGGTGTVVNANVTTVTINCSTNSYLIGGNVSGLFGSGLVLQNNGGGDIPLAGSGSFSFSAPVSSGAMYNVTVATQPTNPWQTCTPSGGSGTVTNANVSVPITCVSNPYSISVNVSGLSGGGFVLQNNAGDNLAVSSNGIKTFATPVRSGLTYAVTILSQPSNPWQTCSVTAPAGTVGSGPVTLAVNCLTNTYSVGGTVTGLTGTGLVLRDNGGDDRSVSADGSFTFATPVASGAAYNVTVQTQPSSPAQSCVVTSGMGTIGAGPVSGVTVSCANVATCAAVDENQTLTLSCPAGRTILSVAFASYGTPGGSCGAYTLGTCHATNSSSIVGTACIGRNSCTVSATNGVFGDPCVGTFKRLWVQASCS